MAGRVLAQILIAGGSFMIRTFAQAYQQAIRNAAAGGGAASTGAAARSSVRGQMTSEEAAQILGVEKSSLRLPTLEEKYQRLWDQNNPQKGGSPYIQYKIMGAKEVLERELIARGEKPKPKEGKAEEKPKQVDSNR